MAGVVNSAKLPEQMEPTDVMAVAADTGVAGVSVTVVAVPSPQALTPVQTMVPVPVPMVTLSVPVVLEPLQPVPVTVQL